MPRTPTPAQARILELLGAFDYLTTRQIHEYLGATTTKRATERMLRRLEKYGYLRGERLQPGRGSVSERCWRLLKTGADVFEIPFAVAADQAPPAVTPGCAQVLRLLADMKQLSTTQIWRHLHPDRSKRYTRLMLHRLRKAGYAHSRQLYPERGAASEHYWMLSKRGAGAIGVSYDMRYRRRPIRESVEHRGTLLELSRQVQDAGWSLIRPISNRFSLLHTEESPQRRQLVEAVLKKEQLIIDALLRQGYPPTRLKERIARYKAGQVGAIVPCIVNEHIAFIPGQPELTVLLIPHPPLAGSGFWTRRPGQRVENGARSSTQDSRIKKYARLAQVLPILAVFSSENLARQYTNLLAAAGFQLAPVEEVGNRLAGLRPSVGRPAISN